ncbi:MAG: hypothetical protein ACK5P7_00525 [Bdellovibrio sp.]|jgi:hypothetical protein
MIKDIMQSTSIERLKGILQSRYGKGLELSFLNDSSDVVATEETSFLIKNGILHIPISSNGRFLAVAKVPDAGSLPNSSAEAITEVVKLILEPTLYSWYLNQSEINRDNLVTFNHLGELQSTQDELELESIGERSPVVLLISHNPHRLPKLALQVHDVMSRWAFVHWNEIRAQIFSVQDLRDLGAMTIFVEDALTLSNDEKFLLNEWIQTSKCENEPALVIGSQVAWTELKNKEILPTFLLEEAGFHQIEADRLPADRRFCEEAIKLLLDKESALQ